MKSNTFGKRLIEVRKAKKLSQDDVAKKLELHGAVIGRYERDEVKPSIEMAAAIADSLEVSLDYLVGTPLSCRSQELRLQRFHWRQEREWK